MGRFFDTMLHRPLSGAREIRILEIIEASGSGPIKVDTALAELAAGEPPSEPALARIASALDAGALDDDTRVRFWRSLAERFPEHAFVMACCGDALLAAGREREAVDAFLAAFERMPALVQDFEGVAEVICAAGGEAWLRYQLLELEAAMDAARAAHAEDADDDSRDLDLDIRERYSELLEDYDGDAAALSAIRGLGQRIRALEAEGVLPQALVRRGQWRRE